VKIGRARSVATVATRGLGSRLPLQVLYFLTPELKAHVERAIEREHFDVIHAMTIRVAPAVLSVASVVPVVVDFMDSFGANISTRRAMVGPLARRVYDLELRRVTGYEREVARRVAGGFVIAQLDRDAIGEPSLAIIPNGVDNEEFRFHAGPREDALLMFTGNMGYGPNVDAVTWFAAECWPTLQAKRPGLRFQIVGARPAPAVLALTRLPGVEVVGRVDSMVPHLQRATIAVCPIRCGSGMQNKLLEAMATGAPVVTTDFANRGIGALAERDLQVAADGPQFIAAVERLLDDADLRARQAQAAREWLDATYSWSRHASALTDLYAQAIAARVPVTLDKAG